jgi:hypothetical protein
LIFDKSCLRIQDGNNNITCNWYFFSLFFSLVGLNSTIDFLHL